VQLDWTTTSEMYVSNFKIEQSNDAIHWNAIGQVEASRNNALENEYHYNDVTNFTGTMYYRIKQLDIDGKYTYSQVRKVMRETSIDISIYPNPCTMYLHISLPKTQENTLIEIYSLDGKKLITEQTNNLTHTINTESLTKGTYLLRVSNSEKTYTTKFVRK